MIHAMKRCTLLVVVLSGFAIATLYGGYGKTIDCGSSGDMSLSITGPANQAECLAEAALVPATCPATVAQAQACTKAMANCDSTISQTACVPMMTFPTQP